MTLECSKIVTDKKKLDKIRKKSLGERHKIMQQRAKACSSAKIKK